MEALHIAYWIIRRAVLLEVKIDYREAPVLNACEVTSLHIMRENDAAIRFLWRRPDINRQSSSSENY